MSCENSNSIGRPTSPPAAFLEQFCAPTPRPPQKGNDGIGTRRILRTFRVRLGSVPGVVEHLCAVREGGRAGHACLGDFSCGGDGHWRRRVGVRAASGVRSHQPWGLAVVIAGHEGIGASIDYHDIAGPCRGWPRPDDFPVGAEIEAVIGNRPGGQEPPRWYYLKIP